MGSQTPPQGCCTSAEHEGTGRALAAVPRLGRGTTRPPRQVSLERIRDPQSCDPLYLPTAAVLSVAEGLTVAVGH